MSGLDPGKCQSCGASILWIVMESGKRMPLDPTPQKLVVVHGDHGAVRICFVSHFATCPNAARHRRTP